MKVMLSRFARVPGVQCLHAGLLWSLLFAGAATATDDQPLFGDTNMIDAVLKVPMSSIYKQRKLDQRDEFSGTLSFVDGLGAKSTVKVSVRTRGNFRRRECRQPPLRLNFEKAEVDGTLFEGQDKLKLVVPCRSRQSYEDLVAGEFMVYRLYSMLGPYHFRVRPLLMEFVDTDKKNASRTSFAFLIEDLRSMASRYDRQAYDQERSSYTRLDQQELATVELFQFMIGGHDWSVIGGPKGERCCHNMRLIVQSGWETGFVPVPYDFDMTGLVDAPYAFPPEQLPIRNVRQRYYRGRCKGPGLWRLTTQRFKDAKEAIYGLYDGESRMSDRAKVKALKYLDGFFKIIEDDAQFKKSVVDRCKGKIPA